MTGPRAEVVTKLSPWSVSDTVARLKAVAEARGIKLLEIIDLTSAAKAVGVETMPAYIYKDASKVRSYGQAVLLCVVVDPEPKVPAAARDRE